MNLKEFAKKIGISAPRASIYIRNGILKESVKRKGRAYEVDFEKAKKELRSQLDMGRAVKARITEKKQGGAKNKKDEQTKKAHQASEQAGRLDFQAARSLNEQYKAALKKLEYDQKKGVLVDINDIIRLSFEAAKQFRDHPLAIPDRVAAIVAASNDTNECKRILSKEISFVLENLSDSLEKLTNAE